MNFTLTDTTSWLAYADYLQDNDQPYQHIIDPQTNWFHEYQENGVGSIYGDYAAGWLTNVANSGYGVGTVGTARYVAGMVGFRTNERREVFH